MTPPSLAFELRAVDDLQIPLLGHDVAQAKCRDSVSLSIPLCWPALSSGVLRLVCRRSSGHCLIVGLRRRPGVGSRGQLDLVNPAPHRVAGQRGLVDIAGRSCLDGQSLRSPAGRDDELDLRLILRRIEEIDFQRTADTRGPDRFAWRPRDRRPSGASPRCAAACGPNCSRSARRWSETRSRGPGRSISR